MQTRLLTLAVFVLAIGCTVMATLQFTGNSNSSDAVAETTTNVGSVSDEALGKAIEKFIANNPEVIMQALYAAKAKEEQQAAAEAEKSIATKRSDIENRDTSPAYGDTDSKLVLVKFNDYNCGYCKRVAPDMEALYKNRKDVKFVVKEFPILGEFSVTLAKASLAFNELNPEKFHEFHLQMLKTTPRNPQQIGALAEKYGVSASKLTAEMENEKHMKEIRANISLATSIGVRGTPAFVIGGTLVRGAVGLDAMEKALDAAKDKS